MVGLTYFQFFTCSSPSPAFLPALSLCGLVVDFFGLALTWHSRNRYGSSFFKGYVFPVGLNTPVTYKFMSNPVKKRSIAGLVYFNGQNCIRVLVVNVVGQIESTKLKKVNLDKNKTKE